MSKTNQQRRQTKAKARRRAATGRQSSGGASSGSAFFTTAPPPRLDLEQQVMATMAEAFHRLAHDDDAGFTTMVRQLADGPHSAAAGWRRATERELSRYLVALVKLAWDHGWEPADVLRVVRRTRTAAHGDLVRDAIAAELSTYAATTVAPRWHAQLAELDARVWWPTERCWLGADDHHTWSETVRLTLELADTLAHLPRLVPLGPLPGAATHVPRTDRVEVDERVLARVRALLAKAESTPYPAEAETFTAGAQAMMARHSIDRALLDATAPSKAAGPGGRRLGIDNPYEGPKAMLLDAVADANRCRSVWSKALGFSTVVGHDSDLDAVELLFTSLLVQAVSAMTRAGAKKNAYGGSRTRSFRQSFLLSYARRIGERLTEATTQQTREAAAEPGGANLLPVLAARTTAVDDAVAGMFPGMVETSVGSAYDREGWATGRAAADLANLRAHPALA